MTNVFENWLETYFDEVDPREFYRAVFPSGELEAKGVYETGKYTAIALGISLTAKRFDEKKNRLVPKTYRFNVTDDLDQIDEMQQRTDLFCLMAPLSYAGQNRSAKNARFMYGMAFDVDHIRVKDDGTPIGLLNLWNGHIERAGRLPKPTYIVSSGTGVHLYYLFERAVPLFPNVVKQAQRLKHELTSMIWNEGIVDIRDEKEIQYEGIYQGFRVPGTRTKHGGITRVFETGDKVTVEYMNEFVREPYRITEFSYKSKLSKAEAKAKYPEWYEERIVEGKKGILRPWTLNRSVYDWWKREILQKAQVGHRYYCLMILATYAMKCSFYDPKKNPNPVTREELESDAYEVMQHFEALTNAEDNHFDESDVLDALDAYDYGMITFPRNSVEYKAGFALPVNRRNGRKRAEHVRIMNFVRDEINGNTEWRNKNGAPTKRLQVAEYRAQNPSATKSQCHRDTGMSRTTINKWWNED